MAASHVSSGWQFWIDRGGTFTDVVARRPDGSIGTHKLLSENPGRYADAALAGIRHFLDVRGDEPIPARLIEAVKMGTTVATNALLERKGEPTALFITKGFRDALRIAYQNRPRIFDRHIVLPEMLYSKVFEVEERIGARGEVVLPIDLPGTERDLRKAFSEGFRSIAIVFMHGYRFPDHESQAFEIAKRIGFTQISVSHRVSPLMKLVGRGDTTVVDAYLSPILRRYVDRVAAELEGVRLLFMQSNGGLTDAHRFQGKDAILSGPAGGIVGAVRTSMMAGFDKIIGFDMGGTSTDVSHFAGTQLSDLEREFETRVAGVRMRAPMMSIHTVAAGGGSILHFDGARYRVGPDSAGADPGPASYRRGGPLTVTDANVMLGKIQPRHFPRVFGFEGNEALDAEVVQAKFSELKSKMNDHRSAEAVAEGFIRIAVGNMANAIKHISVQRGHDVTGYTLCCFGGAAGQHACLVADALAMTRVFIHPHAGVLSAYGMGLADQIAMRQQSVELKLEPGALPEIEGLLGRLSGEAKTELTGQGIPEAALRVVRRAHLKYEGTDTALLVPFGAPAEMAKDFEAAYRKQFSFLMPGKPLVVEAVSVEAIAGGEEFSEKASVPKKSKTSPLETVRMFTGGAWHEAPLYRREDLGPGQQVAGPAILAEANATTVVEPEWRASVTSLNHLVLERTQPRKNPAAIGTSVDPVMLEIFNNLYMSIAEQMGLRLQNTAYSVNIKERLDFSCALFDAAGNLIANAPHMPVHLGSMGESIKTVIRLNAGTMKPGNVYVLNAPYNGGTHLPDVTVITPVFGSSNEILFYVGSRGHHADIGGTTPGSMPSSSRVVEEEGVLIDNFLLVEEGRFREKETIELLSSGRYPARNVQQNIADLRAQVAANEKGVQELRRMVAHFGLEVVRAYMGHVQDNAEESVRRVIGVLKDGEFELPMDCDAVLKARITIKDDRRSAVIDFSGTSPQLPNNYNAPSAVAMAAVLYVFRTLVDEDIPLNAGCLKPLEVRIPEGSMLCPRYPAAVVAGNVETSQCVTETLYGALAVQACGQGTMNNFTFGNARYQYYETVAGGSGAGPGYDGADVVQTHMTNSRLTDPEVLEWRYPVRLESFEIRHGSGGRGKWRGGNGAVRRIRFLEPMTAAILSGHRGVRPYGMAGGAPGLPGRNYVLRSGGKRVELGPFDETQMAEGDVFVVESPGGGGYGPPA
jgi:5-oxoprolinase (ATP-hydrolysing)